MKQHERMTRVLLSGAGGPAAIGVMKAIDDPNIAFYAGDMDPCAAGLYLVPEARRTILLPATHPRFVDAVLGYCRQQQIDVFWPTVDAELKLVSARREEFESAGVRVVLPSCETLDICLDKWRLACACEGRVPLPKTAVFDSTFQVTEFRGPYVVKPRRGSGSRGVRLIATVEELGGVTRDSSLIVQSELPGEEYSVDVFVSRDRQSRVAVPRVRAKVDSGVAVTSETKRDLHIQQLALDVADAIGLTGGANIQFKRDRNGAPRLLEVNPRVAGTMILTVRAGVNIPALALDDCLEKPLPTSFSFEELAVVRTHQEHFISPQELRHMERLTASCDPSESWQNHAPAA